MAEDDDGEDSGGESAEGEGCRGRKRKRGWDKEEEDGRSVVEEGCGW